MSRLCLLITGKWLNSFCTSDFKDLLSLVFVFTSKPIKSYKIMEEISKGFEFNDNTEDGHKMILYSAFFSYDELINCIISVIAFVAGLSLFFS